jgi:hypothetical protein
MIDVMLQLHAAQIDRMVRRTCRMQTAWALHDRNLIIWEEPDVMTLSAAGRSMMRYLTEASVPAYRLQAFLNSRTYGVHRARRTD